MPQVPSERLPLLDGLRTIAALGVLLYHLPGLLPVPLFSRGYLFVDLFFLLSGFVLTLSAEPRMARGTTTPQFLLQRIQRLWPMMTFGLLMGTAVFATQSPAAELLPLLVMALLMVPLLSDSPTLYPLNPPQWSLLWELVANLVHGLLLRRLSDTALLLLLGACGATLTATIAYVGCNCAGPNVEAWWFAAPRIAWSYTFGVWMARKWQGKRPPPLTTWPAALTLPVTALLALPWLPLGAAAGDLLAVLVLLPATFWIATTCVPPPARRQALARLGSLSFPLYAVHMPVVLGFDGLGRSWFSSFLALATSVLLAAGVATLATYLRRKRAGLVPQAFPLTTTAGAR